MNSFTFLYLTLLLFSYPHTVLPASALTFSYGAHTTYCNTINMNRSMYYVHLSPSDACSTSCLTGVTLRVSGFEPKTTKNTDITNLLAAVGVENGTFEILWVDGESFYVNFPKFYLTEVSMA